MYIQVEAELVADRERAAREAERAKQAIRQKEAELQALEQERKKEVRNKKIELSPDVEGEL